MPKILGEVLPFILCGGAGTRLWPLSRDAFPKPFHKIAGTETLFQQTCRRFSNDVFGPLTVITNRQHRFLVAEQLEAINITARIVLESVSRNTAPAACIAALVTARADPTQPVLVAPSDHAIADAGLFAEAVLAGLPAVKEGALVTFGIEPDCPHSGYGYLEVERSAESASWRVTAFTEKPPPALAEEFFKSGRHLWNGGIFLFQAATMLALMERHAPELLSACQRSLDEAVEDLGFLRLGEALSQAPAISLDHAIVEKASHIHCVPFQAPWSDIGSWTAVWDLMQKDATGNVKDGAGEILLLDTIDSYAYSESGCVALIGLENVIVVATEDAVLVASKAHAETVKRIVEQLKNNGGTHALQHNRVYRPWGWYQTVNRGDRYQVKCIMVKPGGKLSLQSHLHRSEHWVVVKGTLEVTKGDTVELLSENQSTYIPIGQPHRLANPGKLPAYLIEVQSGSYLGEDDIIRYDDIYQRSAAE